MCPIVISLSKRFLFLVAYPNQHKKMVLNKVQALFQADLGQVFYSMHPKSQHGKKFGSLKEEQSL